jgi:hypothetical protein
MRRRFIEKTCKRHTDFQEEEEEAEEAEEG